MQRKGKGKKTFSREKLLFSNFRLDMTEYEKLNIKIISLSNEELKIILDNSSKHDILTVSYAKEELSRREFNKKNGIDTKKKRTKLNKKYPEHKHLMNRWKSQHRRKSKRPLHRQINRST